VEELIKTLPAILRSIGDDPEVATAAAITAWNRAAGDGLRQHAIPVNLQDGTLVVAVADAVWQKQLRPMLKELIYKTNSMLGQPLVKQVELVVDAKIVNSRSRSSDGRPAVAEVPPEISSAAGAIADVDLREKFIRAATGTLARRQRET
jgi:predicted nucleic acid-binding Zn ribbon protein